MSKKPENPFAFAGEHATHPVECGSNIMRYQSHPGMTLRDYFAAAALQGLMARPDDNTWPQSATKGEPFEEWQAAYVQNDAEHAYRLADAMLRARQPEKESNRES